MRDYSHGCPVCGQFPAGSNHKCNRRALKQIERKEKQETKAVEDIPSDIDNRTITDRLDEAEEMMRDS